MDYPYTGKEETNVSELTAHAYEADTHEPLTASEVATLPTRKTWYGVVGVHPEFLVPSNLTDDHKVAEARALIKNSECPALGPWRVVELLESLRTVQL
jgi:hypothetical protein